MESWASVASDLSHRRLPCNNTVESKIRSGVLIIHKASVDGPFLACPGSVTQKPLQDFAGAALRKLGFGELDAARHFEKEGSVLESRQNSFGLS